MKKTMLGTICHSDLTLTSDIEKLFKVIVHGVPASTLCVWAQLDQGNRKKENMQWTSILNRKVILPFSFIKIKFKVDALLLPTTLYT